MCFLRLAIFFSMLCALSIELRGQPSQSFFVVHCDPNESYNFPNLEVLVDSANNYNIKLTIEFTAPWIDSIINNPYRLNRISSWQSQGHEIALHHHELSAFGVWDGFTNYSFAEITAANRDTNDYIGDMDSLYRYIQQISSIPIFTAGLEDSFEMPSQSIYQTSGQSVNHGFSNPFSYSLNGKTFCKATHCFINGLLKQQELEAQYDTSYSFQILGANTHVYNFVSDPISIIRLFQFIYIKGISSLTVSSLLQSCILTNAKVKVEKEKKELKVITNPYLKAIKVVINTKEPIKLNLYNINGVCVFSKNATNQSDIFLSSSSMSSGIYLIEVISKNERKTKKIIIN